MARHAIMALLLGWIAASPLAGQDGDPTTIKLEKARDAYRAESERLSKLVADHLDRAEETLRKAGNANALEAHKKVRSDWERHSKFPDTTPSSIRDRFTVARNGLESAYLSAMRAYTREKKDEAAAAVKAEWEEGKVFALSDAAIAYVRLVNMNSKFVLEVKDDSEAENASIIQAKFVGKASQQWQIIPVPNSKFVRLRNRHSGLYAAVTGADAQEVVQRERTTKDNGDQWLMEKKQNVTYFRSAMTQNLISISEGSTTPGAAAIQWRAWDGPDQKWQAIEVKPSN